MASQNTVTGTNKFQIETGVPFSKSKIWQFNRDYYQSNGIASWSEGLVPQHITSNAKIGAHYATLIYSFLKDLAAIGTSNDIVYILELGAGHGRLAFYILKHLDKLLKYQNEDLPPFRYVISDIGVDNLAFFKSHPSFKTYFDRGILDVAYFDAEESQTLELQVSGEIIHTGTLNQPILTIANYFFDSIPNDLFFIKDGITSPAYVSLESMSAISTSTTSDILSHISLKYALARPVAQFYKDPIMEDILNGYRSGLDHTFLLFPVVGIDCINRIKRLSKRGILLVGLDKGSFSLNELDHLPVPDMVAHGSMSFTVNFHALCQHCLLSGGRVLSPEIKGTQLQTVSLMYLDKSEEYQNTNLAIDHFVTGIGADDMDILKTFMYDHISDCSLKDMLVLLKLHDYDHMVFQRILPRIKQLVGQVTHEERDKLFLVFQKVWDTHFSLGKDADLAFEIGGLYYQLGNYQKALAFFAISEAMFGFTADGFYNRMICYFQLRQDDMLKSTLIQAKQLFPDYENFISIENLDMDAK